MSRSPSFAIAVLVAAAGCGSRDTSYVDEHIGDAVQEAGYYGHGSAASDEQIAGWDIDIRPDGLGLPPGAATPEDGEMVYEEKCAVCHGSFGEGVGRYPILAGGEGTLTEARPERTIGSYWPYASTVWDYIHRAMPYTEPESLTDDEVYAITAYVLYLNDLIEYDQEINQSNLADVRLPNEGNFFFDDRPDVSAERCMSGCKDPATIEITSEPELDTFVTNAEEPDVAQHRGAAIYAQACGVCHESGIGDAPIAGQSAAWQERLATGRDQLVANAISGKGIMPPKGGQLQLSDDEVAVAVDYMIELIHD